MTKVLDHGYIKIVETWGSEERIIEAARMSTGKGFLGWGRDEHSADCPNCNTRFTRTGLGHRDPIDSVCPNLNCQTPLTLRPVIGDEKLLSFLWKNGHHTPFEMAGAQFEIQAPIFVFREWHRHRTQSYNELSARYTPLPDENYVPEYFNLIDRWKAAQSTTNKQEAAEVKADLSQLAELENWRSELAQVYAAAQAVYEKGLRLGVPKELARLPVPVARYSRMRASANLRNWIGFLKLRNHPAAQWEIRQFAIELEKQLAQKFPRTLELFRGQTC